MDSNVEGFVLPPRPKVRIGLRQAILAVLLTLSAYAGYDLFWPLQRDLTRFDPSSVTRLETAMWESYYESRSLHLFSELAETLRSQYRFPPLRSYLGAFHGARAAVKFKDGRQRSDYEQALPALSSYFSLIKRTGRTEFDIDRAAALELEWWIVHRERKRHPADALGQACAEAAVYVYRTYLRTPRWNTAACVRPPC